MCIDHVWKWVALEEVFLTRISIFSRADAILKSFMYRKNFTSILRHYIGSSETKVEISKIFHGPIDRLDLRVWFSIFLV